MVSLEQIVQRSTEHHGKNPTYKIERGMHCTNYPNRKEWPIPTENIQGSSTQEREKKIYLSSLLKSADQCSQINCVHESPGNCVKQQILMQLWKEGMMRPPFPHAPMTPILLAQGPHSEAQPDCKPINRIKEMF